MVEQRLSEVRRNLRNYLTFYHEIRIPQNYFFDPGMNRNQTNKLLVISSPSRMGNHILMSMLDSHPELPRIPGEDGFLSFSFFMANYDIHNFISSIRGDHAFEFITHLGSNGGRNKWFEFKQCFLDKRIDVGYAGIQVKNYPNILDYEKIVFDINYTAFEQYIVERIENIKNANYFNEMLQIYMNALQQLDFEKNPSSYSYDSYIAFSGMRTQIKWICETYRHVKVLSSLRSFDSYCISHIKSRYGDIDLKPELIQEAWEHWYHKVIDMIFLKLKYPEQIGLVTFEDLVSNSRQTRRNICDFLEINFHDSLLSATIFGVPVKGNSWKSRTAEKEGVFYQPESRISGNNIPQEAHEVWNSLSLIKL